jgi:hypothetical protein
MKLAIRGAAAHARARELLSEYRRLHGAHLAYRRTHARGSPHQAG